MDAIHACPLSEDQTIRELRFGLRWGTDVRLLTRWGGAVSWRLEMPDNYEEPCALLPEASASSSFVGSQWMGCGRR